MKFRKIIHVDMDYFFAQVEELKDPSLKRLPIGIGSKTGRGVLCTSNYIAREYGVRAAMPTKTALMKCPKLKLIPPVFEDYKKVSKVVFEIFHEYTHQIEGISLDEAYLDVTDCELFGNSAFYIAQDIRKTIFERTGLTCSAGISYNKFLAKLACEQRKPNGQFLISPNVCPEFIGDIDVDKISGVGKVFKKVLNDDSIFKLKDMWCFEKYQLIDRYGKFGQQLFMYSRGIDDRVVSSNRIRKSLSIETTFYEDLTSLDLIKESFQQLYLDFCKRLEKFIHRGRSSIFVKIKYFDFSSTTIERKYCKISFDEFLGLFKERFSQRAEAVRLIGLGVKFEDQKTSLQLQLPLS